MTADPCSPATASENTAAARDLAFLREVRAIRRFEPDGDGFLLELPDRKLLALPAEAVSAFRRGVLVGWTLPRTTAGDAA